MKVNQKKGVEENAITRQNGIQCELFIQGKGKYFILAKITVYQGDMTVMNFYVYIVAKYIKQKFIESQEKCTKMYLKILNLLETSRANR